MSELDGAGEPAGIQKRTARVSSSEPLLQPRAASPANLHRPGTPAAVIIGPVTLQAAGSNLDSIRKELAAIVLETYRTHPLAGWEDRLRIIEHCLAGTDDLASIADILGRWTEQLAASLDYPRPVPDSKKNLQLRLRTAKRKFEALFERTHRISF